MTVRVRFEAEAADEYQRAARWYDEQRAGLGDEFLAAVDAAVDHIAQFPAAGHPVPQVSREWAIRRWAISRFPYHLVYLETTETIRVLAVAHDRRRPAYWTDRSR